MKLAIIHADPARKLSARLTQWFTGSTAYHCGFLDETDNTWFDMSWLARKALWPRYFPPVKWIVLYDFPSLTRAQCEEFLKRDSDIKYGVLDYLLFGLRPIYHLLGKSTRNAGGVICSEMVNNDLWDCGVKTPWKPIDAPPSPCDLLRWKNA